MQRVNYLKNHKVWLIIFAFIIISAFLFRFYNYSNRWGLAYDQAHDAIIARYAIENFEIPLVGPFASGAPVQTGGHWYWFLMAASAIYPWSTLTPWVVLTLLHVLFVAFIVFIGKRLVNIEFGLIAGVLAAFSAAQITQSTNLTLTAPMAMISLFVIWSIHNYRKEKSARNTFLLSFSIALAPITHLSGVGILIFLPLSLFLIGIPKRKGFLYLILGFLLPFIPNLIFDFRHDFVHLKGLYRYVLYDQYRITYEALGRRWQTYIFSFWPTSWGFIIGGNSLSGYFAIIAITILAVYGFYKKTFTKEFQVIILGFAGIVLLLRYVRAPLFDSYLVFLHPFVLFFTAYIVYRIYVFRKWLGIVLLVILLSFSGVRSYQEICCSSNITHVEVTKWKNFLEIKYPNESFTIYDHEYIYRGLSVPLVLYLMSGDRAIESGRKIGVGVSNSEKPLGGVYPGIFAEAGGYQLFDLSASTSSQLEKDGWSMLSPKNIYDSTQKWYKDN